MEDKKIVYKALLNRENNNFEFGFAEVDNKNNLDIKIEFTLNSDEFINLFIQFIKLLAEYDELNNENLINKISKNLKNND